MSGRSRLAGGLLAATLLVAGLPATAQAAEVGTVPLGMNYGSAAELRAAGATPAYSSIWIGIWTASTGWGGLETMLRQSKADGTTPVVYWYYWGDDISPWCVEHGCDNGRKSRAQWDAMTTTLATKVRDIMGGAPTFIVLENEFNKGGITDAWYAPTFDAHLEAKAKQLKGVPGVKVVLGYGAWGEDVWGRFPRAIAASDMIGFQLMRASTKSSEESYRASPDKIASVLDHIRGLSPGKEAFLYDVALSSYPEWKYAAIQDETLRSILDRRAEYAEKGLRGLIYRELRDNPSMGTHNYFGYAEQFWGLKTKDGVAKPSYHTWMRAAKASVPPPTATVPGSFQGEAMSATTGVRESDGAASGGAVWNLWRNGELAQQADSPGGVFRVSVVARGSQAGGVDPRMELRVDGRAVQAWTVASGSLGTYAADVELPAGARRIAVAFTNDAFINGADRNLYVDVVHVAGGSAPPPSGFDAAFANVQGNEWWVQADVKANQPLAGVCAMVDGGACRPLRLQSWGAWAESFYVAPGARVTLRATSTSGETDVSDAYPWGQPTKTATATFTPHDGNEWWVQTKVDASQPLRGVCASVNGGACQALSLRSWGSWAAGMRAPPGAKVVFTATFTDGQTATSGAYTWPVK